MSKNIPFHNKKPLQMAFPRHSQGFSFSSLFACFRQISTDSSALRTFLFPGSSCISLELCILLALQGFDDVPIP